MRNLSKPDCRTRAEVGRSGWRSIRRRCGMSAGLLAAGLAACGGDGQLGPATVDRVEVSQSSWTLTALGDQVRLFASAKDAAGEPIAGKTYYWSTSAANVVAVECDTITRVGNVELSQPMTNWATARAISPGTATISVTVDGISAQVDITVAPTTATAHGVSDSAEVTVAP